MMKEMPPTRPRASYRWHQMGENTRDVTELKEQILKNMWNPQDDT